MGKKTQATGSRQRGEKPALEFIGSLRSQRSIKRQFDLENEIGRFQKLIGFEEQRLVEAKANRMRQARQVAGGQPVYQRNLEDSIAEIELRNQKIKVYQETIADLQKEIDGLQPSHSQAAERAGKQAELARLAEERVGVAESIDAEICVLRGRLSLHAKLTGTMVNLAAEIDFSGQDFDSARFDNLAVSLPSAMQAESWRWLEWFLGMEKDRRECEIPREIQSLPETLAAAHYYRRGEKPLLTEKERAEAERQDPHFLTPTEFEALHYGQKKPEEVQPAEIQWVRMR